MWSDALNTTREQAVKHTNNATADRQLFFSSVWKIAVSFCFEYVRNSAYLAWDFFLWTNSHRRGPSLFVERISRRHQSECTVHQFGLTLNPQTRAGVLCKAPFDEQKQHRQKTQAMSLIHQSLKKAADSRHWDIGERNLTIINNSPPSVCPVLYAHFYTRGEGEIRTLQVKGGVPLSKIFIASSFKSIRLFGGTQASTVRNWARPVVITSLLISTDGSFAMGSAWLAHQHAPSLSSLPSPCFIPTLP